jgi:hypothetical protein
MDALRRIRLNSADFSADKEYDALVAEMDRFILADYASPAHRLSNGVAIYSPVTDKTFNENYWQTQFANGSHWTRMLQNLYKIQAQNRSRPIIRDLKLVDYGKKGLDPVDAARPLSTQGILYTVEGTNLLWLTGMFGEKSEDGKKMIIYSKSTVLDANWHKRIKKMAADKVDYIVPEYKDGSNQRIIIYSGYRYAVSNGKKAFYATINMPLNAGMMTVPIIYDHPSTGKLGGTVYFDAKWWNSKAVVLEVPQKDGTLFYQQIKPAPDADITLLFETIDKEGRQSYLKGATMKWGEGLELLLSLYEPGSYELAITAEAIGGLSDTALYTFQVEENRGLKPLLQKGSKYSTKDLIGSWQYIDAGRFRQNGEIVPLDLAISFAQHPDNKGLLVSKLTSAKRPDFEQVQVALPDTRMMPHLRFFRVSDKKEVDKPDYSVYMTTIFKTAEGKTVMLQQNILNQGIYMAVKLDKDGRPEAASQAAHAVQTASGSSGLEGLWHSGDGESLSIEAGTYRIVQNGQEIDSGTYTVQGDRISVKSRNTGDVTPFIFKVEGDRLQLQDENGGVYDYRRASVGATAQYRPQQPSTQADSQNARLRGKYCSYSSSYGGGYASSNWAYFDGSGTFSYGSSAYSGGSAGSYYGNDGANRGRYSVQGNTIVLQFGNGSSDQARVYNQTDDGRITEVEYGGQVYAGALCD